MIRLCKQNLWMFYFLLLGMTIFRVSHAQDNVSEQQEIRLAKAELALSQNKEDYALLLLSKNMDPDHFHLDSYLFLANFYLQKRLVSKAFRVYHFMIKNLHPIGGKRILKSAGMDTLKYEFSVIPPPSESAKNIYFLMGEQYFNSVEKGMFPKTFNGQLLLNAKKYFITSYYYNYRKADSKYYLGIINSRLGKYGEAIEDLTQAREMLTNNKNDPRESDIQNIDFLMADALIREGHTDSGSIYLQRLYQNQSTSSSLREYANQYLDNLNSIFKIVTITGGLFRDNNIHNLNSDNQEDIESFKTELANLGFPILIGPDALFYTKSFNYFYSSQRHNNFSYVFNFNATEQTVDDERQYDLESRTLFASFNGKYDAFQDSVLKMGYSFTKSFGKKTKEANFEGTTVYHNFSPEIVQSFKNGSLGLSAHFEVQVPLEGDNVYNQEYALSFTPYWKNKYFAPSLSFSYKTMDPRNYFYDLIILGAYNSITTLGTFEKGTRIGPSLSNHLIFIKNLSTFFTIDYGTIKTQDQALTGKELNLELSFSYVFKFWERLSTSYTFKYTNRSIETPNVNLLSIKQYGDEIEVTKNTHSLNLSINF